MSEPKTHLEETVEGMGLLLVWLIEKLGINEAEVRAGVAQQRAKESAREDKLVQDLSRDIGVILDPILEAEPELETSIEFQCPKCGGGNYRTDGMGLTTGYCEGTGDEDRNWPCSFQWERAEDWRVFVLSKRRRFASPEDYNRAYKALHQ